MRRLLFCFVVLASQPTAAESPPAPDGIESFSSAAVPFCEEPDIGGPGDILMSPDGAPAGIPDELDPFATLGANHEPILYEPIGGFGFKAKGTKLPSGNHTVTLSASKTFTVGSTSLKSTAGRLVFGGGSMGADCTAMAFDSLPFDLPIGTPPVDVPPIYGCDLDQCVDVRRSWILAHHHAYQAGRVAAWLSQAHPSNRQWAWSRRGVDENGAEIDAKTSLEDWFGPYSEDRANAVIKVLLKQWAIFRDGETGGWKIDNRCQDALVSQCNSVGHHLVKSQIAFCDEFFRRPQEQQTATPLHEALHHVWVSWMDGFIPRYSPLRDTWYHRHKTWCVAGSLEYMVEEEDALHLAHYENKWGNECGHRNQAIRNIQNYTEFSQTLGRAVALGDLAAWPDAAPPTPTPPAPGACTLGSPGCQCLETIASEVPDGNASIDEFCPENGSDYVCLATSFGAGNDVGICTECVEGQGVAGCPCDYNDQCAPGLSCYGADTANGYGTGTCYSDDPPSWVCLADCEALFYDSQAWCDHHDSMGATCYDNLCTPQKAYECRQIGAKCREGVCLQYLCDAQDYADDPTGCVECVDQADCTELGYPAIFECNFHQCVRPDWL